MILGRAIRATKNDVDEPPDEPPHAGYAVTRPGGGHSISVVSAERRDEPEFILGQR